MITPVVNFLSRHAVSVLAGIGSVGVAVTAVEAARAHVKAQEIRYPRGETRREDIVNAAKARWRCYIRPTVAGAVTIACVIGAARVGVVRTTAAMAALAASKGELADIRDAISTLDEEPRLKLEKAVAERRVERVHRERKPVEIPVAPEGQHIWLEAYTGRYFTASRAMVDRAVNECNNEIVHGDSVSLNQLLEKLGLDETDAGEHLGWGILGRLIEISVTPHFTPDGIPCAVMSFVNPPEPDWYRVR